MRPKAATRAIARMANVPARCASRPAIRASRCRVTVMVRFNRRCLSPIRARPANWMYAKGMSARDIQEALKQLYGVEVSAATISTVTDTVWSLVEAWQNRPLASLYPIVYLDAIHLKLQ